MLYVYYDVFIIIYVFITLSYVFSTKCSTLYYNDIIYIYIHHMSDIMSVIYPVSYCIYIYICITSGFTPIPEVGR
jgi:hypothetical protein